MNFSSILLSEIISEAKKIISRYHEYHNNLHQTHLRNCKTNRACSPKQVLKPDYWAIDKKFNPFYVRKNAKAIARATCKRIEERTYHPNAPHIKSIPKPNGGQREISVYQIQDAAVSIAILNFLPHEYLLERFELLKSEPRGRA